MSLPTLKIGNTQVTAIGWGGMGLSTTTPKLPDEERFKLLDEVYATGCTFWDTADIYGDNEDLLATWFKRTGKRNDIFLATKGGLIVLPERTVGVNGEPEYIKSAIQKSLDRLGTNIDLYYLHRPDPTVPIEKTIGAMAEFVKEGKIKYLGISECSANTLRRAHAVHPISAVQTEYSLAELSIEKNGLLAACRELGIPVVPWAPLGKGRLTGQFRSLDDLPADDGRRQFPRFSKENFPNVVKLADGLSIIAERHNATPGQVALAWLIGQGDVIPIPGSRSVKYLHENLGGARVNLSKEELVELHKLAETADSWTGSRFPEYIKAESWTDTPPL